MLRLSLVLVLVGICHAQLLFTTDKYCTSWPYVSRWFEIGYIPVCLNNIMQKSLVRAYFGPVELQKPVQYADIARLLVLFKYGGWYVDHDVRPTPRCRQVRRFPDTTFGLEANLSMNEKKPYPKMLRQSLMLSQIYGKRHDERLYAMAKNLTARSVLPIPPGVLMYEYILQSSGNIAQTQLWTGTVLPIYWFGCGQQHSHSPPCTDPRCWGCHTFTGTWLQ